MDKRLSEKAHLLIMRVALFSTARHFVAPMLAACQKDSFLKTLTTRVLACTPEAAKTEKKLQKASSPPATWLVTLEDTVLFPEGGGQPSDTGKIGNIDVLHVFRNQDGVVQHRVTAPLNEGEEVTVEVNWTRRFDHMQQHTSQHLITALAERKYGHATTSWTLGPTQCQIELNTPSLTDAQIDELEAMANDVIRQARPVRFRLMTDDDQSSGQVRSRSVKNHGAPVRLIEIDGIDTNTCCGTHVSNTAQLQMIKLLGVVDKTRGNVRLGFIAGNRILNGLSAMLERERAITKLLSSGPEEHVENIDKLQKDLRDMARVRTNLQKEIAENVAAELARQAAAAPVVGYYREDADNTFLTAVATAFRERASPPAASAAVLFLAAGMGSDGVFVVSGPAERVQAIGPKVAAAFEGRGGGKGEKFQGKAPSLNRKKFEAALAMVVAEASA